MRLERTSSVAPAVWRRRSPDAPAERLLSSDPGVTRLFSSTEVPLLSSTASRGRSCGFRVLFWFGSADEASTDGRRLGRPLELGAEGSGLGGPGMGPDGEEAGRGGGEAEETWHEMTYLALLKL